MTEISNVRPDYQALLKQERRDRRLDQALMWAGAIALVVLAILYHFA